MIYYSRVDGNLIVNKDKWVVSLVRRAGHALIVIESVGFNADETGVSMRWFDFLQKTNSQSRITFWAFMKGVINNDVVEGTVRYCPKRHLRGNHSILQNCERYSKQEIFNELGWNMDTDSWQVRSSKVRDLFYEIREELEKSPAFQYHGGNYGVNCTTWSWQKLKKLGIHGVENKNFTNHFGVIASYNVGSQRDKRFIFKPSINLKQKNLLKKLRSFVENYTSNELLIQELKSGHCVAFTAIYLYALWLHFANINQNNQLPMDDIDWLTKTLSRLSTWNPKKILPMGEQVAIERLLSLLQLFQHPHKAGINCSFHEFDKLFFDTMQRFAKREYSIAALFTQRELIESLTPLIIDNKLNFLYFKQHVIGIFKRENLFYYIEANNKKGIQVYSFLDECIKEIYRKNHLNAYSLLAFGFVNFSILDKEEKLYQSYPNRNDLLKPLAFNKQVSALNLFHRYEKMQSKALIMSVELDCIGSVDYILEHFKPNDYVNLKNKQGWRPIEIAAIHGNISILQKLIAAKADVNSSVYGFSTLAWAITACPEDKKYQIVESLLKAGANVHEIFTDQTTPFSIASKYAPSILELLETYASPNVNLLTS